MTELTFGYLPWDTYAVSLTIGLSADEADTPNGRVRLVEKLDRSLDAYPIDLNLLVLDRRGNEVIRPDSGGDKWYVGTRHSFDQTWSFDQTIQASNAIEFEGQPLGKYRLRFSIETENPLIEGREMHLLVAGRRDDGYYPLAVMIYMGLSFCVLLVLTIGGLVWHLAARRDG